MTSRFSEWALFLSQRADLWILFKATIIVTLGLTAAVLTGRSRASLRHLVLSATFGLLLILPVIVLTTTGVAVEISAARTISLSQDNISEPLPAPVQAGSAVEPRNVSSGRFVLPWPLLLRLTWIAGVLILLIRLAVGVLRLSRLRRDGLPWPELNEASRSLAEDCGVRKSVEILLHEDVPAPLTYGVRRATVILPITARNWSEVALRRALVHELEHVRRSDWMVQLFAQVVGAIYWFHPLVWMAQRRLCLEAERACDDAVVQNAGHADYAEQLVSLAQQMSRAQTKSALGLANRSDLAIRVAALLDGHQPRGRVGFTAAVVSVGIAVLALLAIAPVRAVPKYSALIQQSEPKSASVSPADQALFEAAEKGDVGAIGQLLNAGATVNCVIPGDGTPLIAAARNGHLAAVQLLLDRGGDPNLPVRGDGNPLIMAAREGHAEVVVLLLNRGAAIDQVVPGDENALIQASGEGHFPVVKLLVARGANVNTRIWVESGTGSNGEWRSPLGVARKGRHTSVIEFLIAAGAVEE